MADQKHAEELRLLRTLSTLRSDSRDLERTLSTIGVAIELVSGIRSGAELAHLLAEGLVTGVEPMREEADDG